MELRVTELNVSDEITIRTQFSDYSFRVTDPVQCRGTPRGGRLGDQRQDAFFAGTILNANGRSSEPSRLEAGYRFVFLIEGNGLKRLTTSIVTEIILSQTTSQVG
jgi:hypothetical protein